MSDTAIEVYEGEYIQLGTVRATGPTDVIAQASGIAQSLADIVNKRNLYTVISGKKFVRVEGWTTLGAMLGVLPREVATHPIDNGYESTVELIRASDGVVIGRGSAICTRDERNWGKRDDFAVRSMAITRATGKAYRLGFSWIMTLAGYEPTPAEEMSGDGFAGREPVRQRQKPQPRQNNDKPKANGYSWPAQHIQAVMNADLASNSHSAVNMLNLSKVLTPKDELDVIVEWAKKYREGREVGEPQDAAAGADAWLEAEMAKA